MTDHRIRISEGNRKMGMIPSVSLTAVKACGDGVPCAADCYVVRNMYGGPWRKSILASHEANLAFLLADRDAFFSQLNSYLERKRPDFFRYHVSGDWLDADHLKRALELARAHAAIKFLSFTKRHDLLPRPAWRVPRNFALVASMWPGWARAPRGYRRAWIQDGTETRIPRTALQCPGNCESCGACWGLTELGRDVWFKKH